LEVIKRNKLVVELNTGGFDRPCSEFTPGPKLLEMCFRRRIPVTLSSDAHQPSQVARYYDLAISLLKHTGYSDIVGFEKRIPHVIQL
jgi:histidinol-phosphatase (PHP family)